MAEFEPQLRRALIAAFGPLDGRDACAEALGWAWANWSQVETMSNPAGYLYRVGQTAARRARPRPLPLPAAAEAQERSEWFEPRLLPALAQLSEQQRAVVVLVHGYGWSQREVARVLELSVSTVREHLARAVSRLRSLLEVSDVP